MSQPPIAPEKPAEAVVEIGADMLGGSGLPDPAKCAQIAIEVLGKAAGGDLGLTSLSLEMAGGKLEAGRFVAVRAEVDKRTRAIVFTKLEARMGGELVFQARGLFSPKV